MTQEERNYIKNVAIHLGGDYACMDQWMKLGKCVPEYQAQSSYICKGDSNYPACFYELFNPPYIIFYQGNINLLDGIGVGVIGSRKPSRYATVHTKILVRLLKHSRIIVSGLARGIDGTAHREALDFQTIAVLGCGLDMCYPPEHRDLLNAIKKHHLVITEYPSGVRACKEAFPFRNRMIAALSSTVYVMSAATRSGTMHTVNIALELNRAIVCLPHQIDDPSGYGCNQLIQEGAEVLTNLEYLSNI